MHSSYVVLGIALSTLHTFNLLNPQNNPIRQVVFISILSTAGLLNQDTADIWEQLIHYGAVLRTAERSPVSLASTSGISSSPLRSATPKMSPDVADCPLGQNCPR